MNAFVVAAILSLFPAAPLFQGEQNPGAWDFLDYDGDGHFARAMVEDAPPGYGPEVLRLAGSRCLLLVKGGHQQDGTYVALYRERDAAVHDADGVVLVGGAFGDDLGLEHNTKTVRPHLWLEQDNDTGISFRFAPESGEDYAVAESVATGLITDDWNVTDWIWQKVQVTGDTVRAKFWPAHGKEPEDWAIETNLTLPGDRFGIRINSGDIDLAYYAFDPADIPIEAPLNYVYLPRFQVATGESLPVMLFANRKSAVEEFVDYAITDSAGQTVGTSRISATFTEGVSAETFAVNEALGEGGYTLTVQAAEGTPLTRVFLVAPPSQLVNHLKERSDLLTALSPLSLQDDAVEETVRVSQVLLEEAQGLQGIGDRDGAQRALTLVDETLAELHGPAGNALREGATEVPWDKVPEIRETTAHEGAAIDHYRSAYGISFGEVESEVSNFAMGRTYTLRIPFSLQGAAPQEGASLQVDLRDPLGVRRVAHVVQALVPPLAEWRAGKTYWQAVELTVPRDDTTKKVSQPVVLDEYHHLELSLRAEGSGASFLLDNAPGVLTSRVGQSYPAGRFYVSSAAMTLSKHIIERVTDGEAVSISLRNDGADENVEVLFRLLVPSGKAIVEDVERRRITGATTQTFHFSVPGRHRGPLTAEFRVYGERGLISQSALPWVADTESQGPRFVRGNLVDGALEIRCIPSPDGRPMHITVQGENSESISSQVLADEQVLHVPPRFGGYYDTTASDGETTWYDRLVATVVETRDGQLLVNGEPFIVKGVNVHGMDGASPPRTRLMMRILKDLGFNSLRGDYPARWQIDMAVEEGLTYDVLAPFSVASTEEIFGRQDGPPLATSRALTRAFIARYADSAGVLLWNSANEIGGEHVAFLSAMHPLYQIYDPYQRPVHYANLYGQDLWQGQDIMGVNYYFSDTQKAVDRHPLIERSVAIARSHEMPVIYTEFNSYHGAVPTTGVEALDDLFRWGVEKAGLSGGYFYMKGNSDRHPGVFDGGYNTHRIMDDAFHRAFDDATVSIDGKKGRELSIRVTNRRPFQLHGVTFELEVGSHRLSHPYPDPVKPYGEIVTTIMLPEGHSPLLLEGYLTLTTHGGLDSRFPVSLRLPSE